MAKKKWRRLAAAMAGITVLSLMVPTVLPAGVRAASDKIVLKGKTRAYTAKKPLTVYIGEGKKDLDYVIGGKTSGVKGSWSSSKASVAAVDQNGIVTPKKNGTAVITYTPAGGSKLQAKVYVRTRAEKMLLLRNGKDVNSITLQAGKTAKITISYMIPAAAAAAGGKDSTYNSYVSASDESIASVSGKKSRQDRTFTITAGEAGTAKVTVLADQTSEAGFNKSGRGISRTLTIKVVDNKGQQAQTERSSNMAKIITGEQFQAEVLNSSIPVLVDFYADWCGPCKMMSPILDSISEEYAGKIKVVKINVDEDPDIAGDYGVMSIPNMNIFKGGQVVSQIIGAVPEDTLLDKIDAVLEQ